MSEENEKMTTHRQAIIIIAHRGLDQVAELTKLLAHMFEIYIHIDQGVTEEECNKSRLKESEHVRLYSLYNVNWGGVNMLKATLHLMSEALKDEKIEYFHIISGEDWPVRNVKDIYRRFENETDIYMNAVEVNQEVLGKKEYCRLLSYQNLYWLLDVFDFKKIPQKIFVKGCLALQRLMGVNRCAKLDMNLAHGSSWGGMPRAAVEFCLSYTYENPSLLEFLSYGLAAEEYFFQTLFYHYPRWRKKVQRKNYRYILWKRKNGSYPAILDEEDYDSIYEGEYYFARKVRFPVSEKLVRKLDIKNGNNMIRNEL